MPKIGTDLHDLSAALVRAGWDKVSVEVQRGELIARAAALGEPVCLVAFCKPREMPIERVYVLDGETWLQLTQDSHVPDPVDASNLLYGARHDTEEARERATIFTNGRSMW